MPNQNTGWKTETYYKGDSDEVDFVSYGETYPGSTSNGFVAFFDTEEEAAQDFLNTIQENPNTGYPRSCYKHAQNATQN